MRRKWRKKEMRKRRKKRRKRKKTRTKQKKRDSPHPFSNSLEVSFYGSG